MAKHLEVKVTLANKNNERKENKYATRCNFEERKFSIEEQQMKLEKRVEEKRFMMLDPTSMEPMAREFWDITREEIMFWRKQELHDIMVGYGTPANGGGGDFASPNGGVVVLMMMLVVVVVVWLMEVVVVVLTKVLEVVMVLGVLEVVVLQRLLMLILNSLPS